jgi:hypothetical protein
MGTTDRGYEARRPDPAAIVTTARRESTVLRVVGGLVATASGPLWAYAIARSLIQMDRDVIDHLDDAERAVYATYWFVLTCLMFFGATVGYFALRAQRWPVLGALRAQQLALALVSAAALGVAALR